MYGNKEESNTAQFLEIAYEVKERAGEKSDDDIRGLSKA